MTYLLDTNVCIRFLNGTSPRILDRLQNLSPVDIALCSVVKAELIYGALRSRKPDETLAKVLHFCEPFLSFAFDDSAAEAYGRIRSHLQTLGRPIGPNDLLIAAIACANGVTLVTHNTREFARVPGLQLDDWE
jgi:tRNA(fMet)-specific endonuclease VapC